MKKANVGNVVGMVAAGVLAIVVLNAIATNPRVSPLWRKIAQTAEGDVFQHIIDGTIVTLL